MTLNKNDITDTLGTITEAWNKLADGNEQAADVLWDRYYTLLVAKAHSKTGDKLDSTSEDIATATFQKLLDKGVAEKNVGIRRDEIRALLLTMTVRLSISAWRKEKDTLKRGKGFTRVSDFEVTRIVNREPTSDEAAAYNELVARIRLHPKMIERRLEVFELILAGATKNTEIAAIINARESTEKTITEGGVRHHKDAIREIVLLVAPDILNV